MTISICKYNLRRVQLWVPSLPRGWYSCYGALLAAAMHRKHLIPNPVNLSVGSEEGAICFFF